MPLGLIIASYIIILNKESNMRKLIVLLLFCILTQGCTGKLSTNDEAAKQEFAG